MSHIRLRQVSRLENLARHYVERGRQDRAEEQERVRKDAFVHVANLALLILYGNPKIDEPLRTAWERCRESAAWRSCREKHGGFDEYGREQTTPFDHLGAEQIAKYFRVYLLPDLPGADETEKLNAIFEIAEPWLLWFTYGDVWASIFGLKLPDLSGVTRFARGEFLLLKLTDGPFECHSLPDGVYDEFEVASQKDVSRNTIHMTRRERKRALRVCPGTSNGITKFSEHEAD